MQGQPGAAESPADHPGHVNNKHLLSYVTDILCDCELLSIAVAIDK